MKPETHFFVAYSLLQPVEAASHRKFAGENNILIYVESSMGCTCSLI
jgi:hypothetical protein